MKCSFCGSQIREGTGKIFVKTDGRIFHFCGSKCQKNWNMKRSGKNVSWTKTAHDLKGKA